MISNYKDSDVQFKILRVVLLAWAAFGFWGASITTDILLKVSLSWFTLLLLYAFFTVPAVAAEVKRREAAIAHMRELLDEINGTD